MAADFVARDHELESAHEHATEELAKHRWHWTLDESNPERISLREYARRVSRALSTIQAMAHGYAAWTDRGHAVTPGGPASLFDYIEQAKLGAERAEATQAVAATSGKAFSTIATKPQHRREVTEVLDTARERAERKGTTVSEEIPQVAEWRQKARSARQRERDERQVRRFQLVEVEGHLGYAMRRLRQALAVLRDVDFDEEETEVIVDTIEKLKTVVQLIDVRITGETGIDWDDEFARVMEGEGS